MENEIAEDIGEEIISQLEELILILDKIKEKKNAKECPFAHSCKYRISRKLKVRS